jgi:hypothetical protein
MSGSRLYGTDVPDSDYDYRGFVVPPFEYLSGIKSFESVNLPGDHKVYSLYRWLTLVLNGDPQCTELMFVPQNQVQKITEIGQRAIGIGLTYALSNKSFSRIMGYSNGEWRKAMAVKLVPEKVRKGEPQILNEFWNCYDWITRDEKELILRTVNDGRPFKLESSMSGLGKKRKAQVEKHGYCTKSAAHSIRLLGQVTELMLTGEIAFPRPDAEVLRGIRNGCFSKDEVALMYEVSRGVAENARPKSILPDKPDFAGAMEEYTQIVKEFIVEHLK